MTQRLGNDKRPTDETIAYRDYHRDNIRLCPSCGILTLKGMPGGRDAVCKNCGYKDPCCE